MERATAMPVPTFFREHLPTPTGPILIVTDAEQRLRATEWVDHEGRMHQLLRQHYGAAVRLREAAEPSPACRALQAYFEGDTAALAGLAVVTNGTAFQHQVWVALRRIPVGRTITYSGLAAAIGRPKATRAVGLANATNPIPIVIPCHRVIGADGTLTGFGGGLDRKRWLLAHEGAQLLQ
jgi:methylated-DNA-[protein]-cysteine S-methyltransferase